MICRQCSDYLVGSNLLGFGGAHGKIECWDSRSDNKAISKDIGTTINQLQREEMTEETEIEVTAIKFGDDGLSMTAGTNTGHVLLYDLRSSQALLIKDHYNGFPIIDLKFHEKKIVSTDRKACKIWDRNSGQIHAAIESSTSISSVYQFKGSGLFTFATSSPQMSIYFVPSLGPSPRWCQFLNSITEELEEDSQEISEHFKFITKQEVQELGISKMIGTSYLRAHMHGYWINYKFYNKLIAIANPSSFQEYKQQKIEEKIDEERKTRLGVEKKHKLPKVNANLAASLVASKDKNAPKLLEDDRFKSIFSETAFEIDEEDEAYKRVNFGKTKTVFSERDLLDHFELPAPEEPNENHHSDSDSDDEIVHKKQPKGPSFYKVKTGHEHLLSNSKKKSFDKGTSFHERVSKRGKSEEI